MAIIGWGYARMRMRCVSPSTEITRWLTIMQLTVDAIPSRNDIQTFFRNSEYNLMSFQQFCVSVGCNYVGSRVYLLGTTDAYVDTTDTFMNSNAPGRGSPYQVLHYSTTQSVGFYYGQYGSIPQYGDGDCYLCVFTNEQGQLVNNNIYVVGIRADFVLDTTRDYTIWQYRNYPLGLIEGDNLLINVTAVMDPYEPGGTTGDETTEGVGGEGDFDGTSDPVDFPDLPTLSSADTTFITLFNPSAAQLKNLANYMWNNPAFDLSVWRKIFADPMDAILGLSIVPVSVPDGGTATITVGNISTGITMTKAAAQFVTVDCGTIDVPEYWGAYLDYDPYTKIEIYLPYIGTHAISADDVVGKTIHVKYRVDILSGACCAHIKCGNSVLYTFVGQCSCSVPITGNDWTNVINGALSIAASVGTMVATGGASAPMQAGLTAGRVAAAHTIASAAVNELKPRVEKSGALGGMGGMLGVQKPYLIITRPRQALPREQNMMIGYPSYITTRLSACTGFTLVEAVHLKNIPATADELSEIETLLCGGVIL